MKLSKYLITFKTGEKEKVFALGEKEARILAQAEQIKKGNRYDIEKVTCLLGKTVLKLIDKNGKETIHVFSV